MKFSYPQDNGVTLINLASIEIADRLDLSIAEHPNCLVESGLAAPVFVLSHDKVTTCTNMITGQEIRKGSVITDSCTSSIDSCICNGTDKSLGIRGKTQLPSMPPK